MLELLSRYWWVLLLRGLAAITFGVVAFMWPGISITALVLVFGAYVLVDGIFSLIAALSGKTSSEQRWLTGIAGALGILFGALTFIAPAAAALALLLYIAAWSLATGVLQIVAAIRLRKEIKGEFWLGLGGALSIAFAVFVLLSPGAGALAVIWLISAYAVAFGITLVFLSLRLKSHKPAAA